MAVVVRPGGGRIWGARACTHVRAVLLRTVYTAEHTMYGALRRVEIPLSLGNPFRMGAVTPDDTRPSKARKNARVAAKHVLRYCPEERAALHLLLHEKNKNTR